MDEVTTRLYQEGDDEEIVALLRSAFDLWAVLPNPLEVWKWKYRQSPLETNIIVSTVGEEVVGAGHCIKMNVKLGNRVLTSFYDDDYVTKPEYRKLGVYKAITNLTDEVKKDASADFCYWITSNPIILTKTMIHEQVTFPAPFSDLIRVKNIDQFIEKFSIEETSLLRASYLSKKEATKPIPSLRTDFSIIDVELFDERFESFWDKISDNYDYFLMRNNDYMNWRFNQNPNLKYKVKAAISNGKIIGCVVIEVFNDKGYLDSSIFDLLFHPNRIDVISPLFEEAIHYCDSLDVDCISLTTMQDNKYQKIAESLGFFIAPYASDVHVRFWGYNEYFYHNICNLRPEKTYFSYSDYY